MHEARATSFKRGWIALAAALLLVILALLLLPRERRNATPRADGAATVMAASSSPPSESTAEKARRTAIAALGPLKYKGTNAADFYKEAMGLYAELTEEEKDALEHRPIKMDAKEAEALYAKIQPIMDLLRRGRKADYVDWGLAPGPAGIIAISGEELQGENNLADLALWDATYRFQTDPDGAVGDVAAMVALGRSGDDSLIGFLVQVHIQSGAIFLLAQSAGNISSAAGPDFTFIVSPAAVEQSFQMGMDGNASRIQSALVAYADPATRSETESQLQAVTRNAGPVSPGQVISAMEWAAQTEQALATTVTEPEAQFQQWWNQKLAEASSMPAANTFIPGLTEAVNYLRTSIVASAMLQAGMALEQNDQAQFQSILDPASGQPFAYTQTANGFQLGSALQQRGKPLSLSFSTPAAK